EAVGTYRAAAQATRISLELTQESPLPVLADPQRVIQVMHNLLSNALKFTPAGGSVQVRSFVQAGEAVVTVEDTGIGFAPRETRRLFHAFSQLDSGDPGAFRGAGLGLYISLGIMHQHGGRMWAKSQGRGKGALFGMALPLASVHGLGRAVVRETGAGRSAEEEFARRVRSLV
ncbi:MAG: sensor histidine kinase, partial [Thermoplasmatota archaeon]